MIWQDVVIFIANFLFGYSLVYQVYRGFKDKKGYLSIQTSFFTASGLYALTFVYFTLSFFASSIISFFNGTLWLILLIQRFIYAKV